MGWSRRGADAVLDPLCDSEAVPTRHSSLVLETARPRAGRRFAPSHELELEDDAVRAAHGLPGAHRGLLLLREASGPFGVPDLLAVIGSSAKLTRRLELAIPPLLNQIDAGITSVATPRAPRSPETLARRLGWTSESVRRRLPELLRSGALIRVGRDSYVRPDALQPIGRLYAIETKVKEWRRAVRQARTYSLWCDSYVLVMGSLGTTALAQVAEAVAADGGGLMVNGLWVQRPVLARRHAAQRMWGSEHLVAALGATPQVDT